MQRVIEYIEQNRDRYLQELNEFLVIPSISNDPQKKGDVGRAAEFVASQLRNAGMSRVEIFSTPGHPIVFAERIEDSLKPTVLIYAHYDVQPVDPLDLWTTPPFEPAIRDNRIYARGAADDKGQMMIHFKSVEALMQIRGKLPVNVKFLVEGEEEIGSPSLDGFIRSHVDLLKADTVAISDTAMFAKGVPSICYGLRGLAYMEIEVIGPNSDLHSGSYGGPVDNPANVLAGMLSDLKDENGRITIPRFYDDVIEPTQRERDEFARLPFDSGAFMRELGVEALDGEAGFTTLEQLWVRPTLDINGLLSGYTGEGAKTVIPAKAMAKVSMRLVPNQDPDRIKELFTAHVRSLAPLSVKVDVRDLHSGKPWVASLDHPAMIAAARAIEKGFGKSPVFQREGGSIPIVATFTEILKVPTVLMGFGLPDENAHAPNEWLDLDNFFAGIKSSAHYLDEVAKAM